MLENAGVIAKSGVPYIVRIPFVPKHNGTEENILAIRNFILAKLKNPPMQIQILRFRELGEEKYETLGVPYPMKNNGFDKDEMEKTIRKMAEVMAASGLNAVAGTTTPIKK